MILEPAHIFLSEGEWYWASKARSSPITGASSGIGRATAKLLAKHGAFVVLGARNEKALAAIVDEITIAGGKAALKVTDVRNRSDLEALVALAVKRGGKLDAIVNNAGMGRYRASMRCASRTGTP